MRIFHTAILAFTACGSSCVTTNDPPPVRPVPVVIVDSQDGCSMACDTGRKLGCKYAETEDGDDDIMGTADDRTCEDVCRFLISAGFGYDRACYSAATSCEESDLCSEGASVPEDDL